MSPPQPGSPSGPAFAPSLVAVLACPRTRTPLLYVPAAEGEPECLLSVAAQLRYPIDGGVAVLLTAEATAVSAPELERLRARAIAASPGSAGWPAAEGQGASGPDEPEQL
jgi:uncharacterized protein